MALSVLLIGIMAFVPPGGHRHDATVLQGAVGTCSTYVCPTLEAPKSDGTVCPDKTASGDCEVGSVTNTEACCPNLGSVLNVKDDYTALIAVNIVGALPLAIVIALLFWSLNSIKHKEKEELDNIEQQIQLFQDMEKESMRRSVRSSMFMNSMRRKSLKVKCSTPVSQLAVGRSILLKLEKRVGGDIGFAVEDLVVVNVEPDSPAEHAGMTKGMIVKLVNERPVTTQSIYQTIRDAGNVFTMTVLVKEHRESTSGTFRSTASMSNLQGSAIFNTKPTRLVRIRITKPEDEVLGMQLTGLDVTTLKPGGAAEQAGVKTGMQVHSICGVRANPSNVMKLVTSAPQSFLADFAQEYNPHEPAFDDASCVGTMEADTHRE